MKKLLKSNRLSVLFIILFSLFTMNISFAQCNTIPVTGVTSSNVTSTKATFSWALMTPQDGARYHFEIRTAGLPGSGIGAGYFTSGDADNGISSVNITGLNFNTIYYFYIRYDCIDLSSSAWSSISITTQPLQAPVSTAALYVSSKSFVAKWDPVDGATSYKLDVSKSSTFASGQFVTGYNNKVVTTASDVVNPVGGLTPSTLYYYRVRAVGSGGQPISTVTSGFSGTITVTTLATPLTYTVWTESGWSQDPTFYVDAIIDWNYSTTISGNFDAKSLLINTGFTVTVTSGFFLTIDNEITNYGSLIVESNANINQVNDDVLVPNNAGNITVKRQSAALYQLDYTMWSSPVTGSETLQQFSPLTNATRFYKYDTANNKFKSITSPSTTTFTEGAGYLIRVPENWVTSPSPAAKYNGSFTGIPHNKTVSLTLDTSGKGYNMVGNPYPCVISAENFLDNNVGIEGQIYFWSRTNNVSGGGATNTFYATYTTAGGTGTGPSIDSNRNEEPNGFIQVGQGFLVKDNPDDTFNKVEFYNSLKTGDNLDNQFFKSSNPRSLKTTLKERNRVWLNLTSASGVFSQSMVCYMTDASNGLDRADGKFINDSEYALTSAIDGGEYVIQSRALPFSDTDVVPMIFKTPKAGDYTITLDHMDGLFVEGQNVYIKDNLTNTTHDIVAGAYNFSTDSGVFKNRFEIVYKSSSLSTTNPTLDANAVVVYKSNEALNINTGAIAMKSVELYDMSGRMIYKKSNIDTTRLALSNLNFQDQIIIIKITTAAGIVNKKFSFTR